MEKVATYKQDWTGVMVFMLGNWVIKNIYGRIFTLAENTTDTINIKIR